MKTTLNKIKNNELCKSDWDKLLASLGKTEADDELIELSFILQSIGLDHALWALRAVDGYEKEIRLFAVFCARQVQHLITDERSINAIDVAERFANGEATELRLAAARAAARDAAWADAEVETAAWAAWAAAMACAKDAAWAAAKSAEGAAEMVANKNNEPAITTSIQEEFKKLILL